MAQIASQFAKGGRLPIDENHATDLGGRLGMPAPARGWITALQARGDGLWGKVEWTDEGRRLIASKAYVGLSPAILHTASGEVLKVLRASLTNAPNLQGLTTLHSFVPTEGPISSKAKPTAVDNHVMKLLGLNEDEYFRELEAANKREASAALPSAPKPLVAGAPLAVSLNAVDHQMMHLFGMNETEWRSAVAAEKAKAMRMEAGQ
jgi:phage I-like protein